MNRVTEKRRVIIGAGKTEYPGWIATQEDELNLLKESDWLRHFQPDSIDCLLAEHIWEHMSFEEGIFAAENCYRFLKSGGYVRCAVPDAFFRNEWYQNLVQVGGPGPVNHPAVTHQIVYNYKQLQEVFERAGFVIDLLEYCDENGAFHYKYWNEGEGMIHRSFRFDTRNRKGILMMVSIILDAKKI
ncbi:MAG TPA: hypothetical protein PLO84_09780 [Thermotogota bacterium]|nr:hypothetical protein [Thermotogota bacterium]